MAKAIWHVRARAHVIRLARQDVKPGRLEHVFISDPARHTQGSVVAALAAALAVSRRVRALHEGVAHLST